MYEGFNTFPNNIIKIVLDPEPTREDEIVQDYKPVFATELTIKVITDRKSFNHLNLKPFVVTWELLIVCLCGSHCEIFSYGC